MQDIERVVPLKYVIMLIYNVLIFFSVFADKLEAMYHQMAKLQYDCGQELKGRKRPIPAISILEDINLKTGQKDCPVCKKVLSSHAALK